MTKKFLFIAAFSSVSLFANEMLIKQNVSIDAKISPTTYFSNIQVIGNDKLRKEKNLSLKDKNSLIKTFNSLNDFIKNSEICKGGNFSITPFYEYKDNKKEQTGFESNYHLDCEFKEEATEDFNTILDFIQKETQENPYLIFPIPKITKNIKEEDLKALDDTLNQKLIQKANAMALEYSKILNKKCLIKEITLGEDTQIENPILYRTQALAKSNDNALEKIEMPTAKEITKSADGKVIFICK